MRLVGYVRISDERELEENQEFAIYKFAGERGYNIVKVFKDVGVSGVVTPREREGWRKVLEVLESEDVDGVIVYALDRVARSLWDLSNTVRELESKNKVLISVREEWLQSVDPKLRQLLVIFLGWAGEMEREFIRMRTKEALARLKAEGKHIGRPPVWSGEKRKRLITLVSKGISLKEACQLVGVSYTTALRHLSKDAEYLKARMEARLKAV